VKFLCDISPWNNSFASWIHHARILGSCSLWIDNKNRENIKHGPGITYYYRHSSLLRKVQLHDPATLCIYLHSGSPLHFDKLLKVKTFYNYRSCIFRYIEWRISCCHFYVGHFAVSVYVTNSGMCQPLVSGITLPSRYRFWLVFERLSQVKWEKSWTGVNFSRWEIFSLKFLANFHCACLWRNLLELCRLLLRFFSLEIGLKREY